MKKILVFALLFLLILPAQAAEADVHALQRDELGLEGVEDAAEGYMDGFTPEDMDLDGGLAGVLEQGESALPGVLRQGVRSCALLLAVVLLCSLADGLSPAAGEAGCPEVRWYESREAAKADLLALYAPGDALLLKASHFFGRFDLMADFLREYPFSEE